MRLIAEDSHIKRLLVMKQIILAAQEILSTHYNENNISSSPHANWNYILTLFPVFLCITVVITIAPPVTMKYKLRPEK
jgi:hypothetical protein